MSNRRNRNFRILEYDKITDMLASHASCEPAKKKCLNIHPFSDTITIEEHLADTDSALKRIYRFGDLSCAGVKDVRSLLHAARAGGSLSAEELLEIARILEVAEGAKKYDDEMHSADESAAPDHIQHFFDDLEPLQDLLSEIRRCIIDEDTIADDASPSLKRIREDMIRTNAKIRETLNRIISNPDNQTRLQDSLITMRNNRYCIPVKSENKSDFPGMVHDQSGTGATLFIEPMGVVNLNNDLAELAVKEQQEIAKILESLTKRAGSASEFITADLEILTSLDFIFAKARFARDYDGSRPSFNDRGIIDIKKGRHPLLDRHKVVPVDISLGRGYSMLIITGPNTGGKTVSLKTLGLFTLMGESGLLIPADQGSELSTFDRVFADIGDEQSIEMSLSTFSSHMTHIVDILKRATSRSLVLFDELGGGTDPTEGAALATAILSHLHEMGVTVAATTHYSELKVYALSTPGVENACCEFSLETLSPTYRLLIGIPGKSNAFAIASKLGLPREIIENAEGQIDQTSMDMEKLLGDLEESRVTIEKEREEIENYKSEIETLRKNTQEKNADVNRRKDEILKKAREQARDILEKAKNDADQSIRLYNKWKAHPEKASAKAMEQQRTHLRKELDHTEKNLVDYTPKKKKNRNQNHTFTLGDYVYVESMGLDGEIITKPDRKGDCYVQAGFMKVLANVADMTEAEPPAEEKPVRKARPTLDLRADVPASINVIGKTVDEAVAQVDKYLDNAIMARLPEVTIVHGKGTGALKNGIRDYLDTQSSVKSYRDGNYGEGDAGVTVVTFR